MQTSRTAALAAFFCIPPSWVPAQPGATSPPASPSGSAIPDGVAVPTMLSEQEVRRLLERDGYREIRDLRPDGDAWTARAWKNGEEVMLVLDSHDRIEVMR